jgi:hypothetical protein
MLKIAQVNVGRDEKATANLNKRIQKSKYDIIAISEPRTHYNHLQNSHKVNFINKSYQLIYTENNFNRPKSAIMIKKNIEHLVDRETSSENITAVMVKNIIIIACYCEPQIKINDKRTAKDINIELNQIKRIIDKYNDKKILILTDSNAWHTAWGNRETKERGEKLYEFIIENQLQLINDFEQGPTFTKTVIEQNSQQNRTREKATLIYLSLITNLTLCI